MSSLAVGIGCRRGVTPEAIVALVREALAGLGVPLAQATLFTIAAKADDVGLQRAATLLGVRVTFVSRDELAGVATPTRSAASLARFGVGSIAESAALAGAGDGATLVVPRLVRNGVTCAVARTRTGVVA